MVQFMTPENRKRAEKELFAWLDRFDESGTNTKIYKETLPSLSDKQFLELVSKPIPLYDPNGGPTKIDHRRTIELCKELGYDIEQYLWLTDPKTGFISRTKYKHLVVPLPVRRQTQMIDKKMSVPEHNRTFDKTTGQVTGASRSSSFSFPQLYIMYSKGYDMTNREFFRTRGGNVKAGAIVDRQIRQQGNSSQHFIGEEFTSVKSTRSASAMLKTIHIGNNMGVPDAKR